MTQPTDELARSLVLDELFDLTLYIELKKVAKGNMAKILGELIPVETEHTAFWKKFFGLKIDKLNFRRRLKLRLIIFLCRIFGTLGIRMVLEAIEVYGIRKYLAVWERYKDQPLGEAVRRILDDEFHHEDSIVSQANSRTITPKLIQSIFLGFNDGTVEILGAVSGFFAAFHQVSMVLMAALTVATAGAISMAAGAYVAASSEHEVESIEHEKEKFYGRSAKDVETFHPFRTSLIVGISYFIGAMVPISPVLIGSATAWPSVFVAGFLITLLSFVLAFLSGMNIKKRILTNLVIIAGAVTISYAIGTLAKMAWGISI